MIEGIAIAKGNNIVEITGRVNPIAAKLDQSRKKSR
jgi:hypothetical protein